MWLFLKERCIVHYWNYLFSDILCLQSEDVQDNLQKGLPVLQQQIDLVDLNIYSSLSPGVFYTQSGYKSLHDEQAVTSHPALVSAFGCTKTHFKASSFSSIVLFYTRWLIRCKNQTYIYCNMMVSNGNDQNAKQKALKLSTTQPVTSEWLFLCILHVHHINFTKLPSIAYERLL